MMIEKECGLVKEPQFPSIWKLDLDAAGTRQWVMKYTVLDTLKPNFWSRYRHSVTNIVESCPTPVRGGMLADVGKHCLLLALGETH